MIEGNKGKFYLFSNLALFLLLAFLSYLLIFRKIPYIPILDDGNLLIHEAGHIIFRPFGNLIGLMGGSILQLIVPTLFLVYFLRRLDYHGISFSIFWIGGNLINISYYVADAQTRLLPLVGGGRHDWYEILSELRFIKYSSVLGTSLFYVGSLILVISLIVVIMSFFRTGYTERWIRI